MGRYKFAPSRVHQAATLALQTKRIDQKPPWYDVVGSIRPPQILVRTQRETRDWTQLSTQPKRKRKASKMFAPCEVSYPEDRLRYTFFKDHPWELARPKIVLENDGKDGYKNDWSSILPDGKGLSGENVVQRQMYLIQYHGMQPDEAYDQARQEFYDERLYEDLERQTAEEEARMVGAYFGKSQSRVGIELEDKEYERWRAWAKKEAAGQEMRRQSRFTGLPGVAEEPDDAEEVQDVAEAAPEEQKPTL